MLSYFTVTVNSGHKELDKNVFFLNFSWHFITPYLHAENHVWVRQHRIVFSSRSNRYVPSRVDNLGKSCFLPTLNSSRTFPPTKIHKRPSLNWDGLHYSELNNVSNIKTVTIKICERLALR